MSLEKAISLEEVRKESLRYGPIAYIATVSPLHDPHLAPVAVSWFDGDIYAFVLSSSVKVRNARSNPRATVHFAVGANTDRDSCIVWGDVTLLDTTQERQNLWDKMGYDLAPFEPGGPTANSHVFLRIIPTTALILRNYGLAGRETWSRS